MSDKRPARSRKTVNYAKFGDPDDFDDDFANLTPPPSKKQKTSSNKGLQKKAVNNQEKKKSVNRTPLAEKVYERELQAALELSLIDSQTSNCDGDDDDDFKPKGNKKPSKTNKDKVESSTSNNVTDRKSSEVLCTVEVNEEKSVDECDLNGAPPDETCNSEEKSIDKCDLNEAQQDNSDIAGNLKNGVLKEIKTINGADGNDSDGIVVLDDEEENTVRGGRRKSTVKKAKVVIDDSDDNDSEFALDEEEDDNDDSDDDYDDENDSDFDCGSKKKTDSKKKSVSSKPQKQTKTKATPKTVPSRPSNSSKVKTSVTAKALSSPAIKATPIGRSPASRPVSSSPVVRTVPKWNPPGSAGSVKSPVGNITIKSPSSGMRVGLSRNQRVRSLHPGLAPKTS